MKDQYFGDINDYRKYGLLRAIIRAGDFNLMVAWMLTPDDESADGKFTSYLEYPKKWEHHDPELFQKIKKLLVRGRKRRVRLMENSDLLQKSDYFSVYVTDNALERSKWLNLLTQKFQKNDFVFLDPDNGLEVKSKAYGRKNSSKYLYWREVQMLWASGKSLLIYQHFNRENRSNFIQRMLVTLRSVTPGSFVEAFSTPYVVFLMALQPAHQKAHAAIVKAVEENWKEQIRSWTRSHLAI